MWLLPFLFCDFERDKHKTNIAHKLMLAGDILIYISLMTI